MKVKIVIKFSQEKENLIEQITVETDAPEMQNNLKKSATKQPITSCSSPMRYFYR